MMETVTFLFTDIEGSTELLQRDPTAAREAMDRHDVLVQETIRKHGGSVFKHIGDAFCAAFSTALAAVEAAVAAQLALIDQPETGIRLRVRMALHTGAVEAREGDYQGLPLHRLARLLSAGHGGQILLSHATYSLVQDSLPEDVTFHHHGTHRLKDLQQTEQIYQLQHPRLPSVFPALRTLDARPNNLPRQLTTFIGRERQMSKVKDLLSRTCLLSLTGAGGSGKTRLAIQIAADLLDVYPDGVWLVELAALADPTLVPRATASVLNVREEPGRQLVEVIADHLKHKVLLLLLDNC